MVVKGVVHVTVPSLNNKHEDILVDILGEEAFFLFVYFFLVYFFSGLGEEAFFFFCVFFEVQVLATYMPLTRLSHA
jgi:hypothetical protein